MSATWKATLLVALSACCFGSIAPLTLIAQEQGAALQGIQSYRYGTTALLLLLVGAWQQRRGAALVARADVPSVRPWWHPLILITAGVPQATVATLALLALRWIPAATASFLFYTFPAWVAIITAARGQERITRQRAIALGLALVGIVAMVGAPDAAALHPFGILAAVGAALIYAAYIPVLDMLQRDRPSLDVSRAIAVGGAVLFISWALATGALFEGFGPRTLAASMLQGVLSTGAFLGFLKGLAALGPVRTAITSTVEPFWTTLLGAVVLAQPIGIGTMVGGVAIMAAVVLLQRGARVVAPDGLHSS